MPSVLETPETSPAQIGPQEVHPAAAEPARPRRFGWLAAWKTLIARRTAPGWQGYRESRETALDLLARQYPELFVRIF